MSGIIPLQLDEYYFTRVNIEANLDFELDDKDDDSLILDSQCDLEVFQNKEEKRRWQIRLNFKPKNTDTKSYPYKIDIQVIGFFNVSENVEEEKAPYLVRANGTAILYSALREFILLITGRGPWPSVTIPTTNFLSIKNQHIESKVVKKIPKKRIK